MARINPTSLESLRAAFEYQDPLATAIQGGVGGLTQGLDLADTLASRKIQHTKDILDIQKQVAAARAEAATRKNAEQLSRLAQPATAETPLSSVVPATPGNVEGGASVMNDINRGRSGARSRLATILNPTEASKQQLSPDKYGTADTAEGVIAYNKENPSENYRLGSPKPTGAGPEAKDEDRLLKFGETLSLNKNSRSPASQAQISLNNIVRAKALVDQVVTQPGGPDSRQTYELALAQVRALIGSQQISEKEVGALLPSTFKGNINQFLEKVKNEPIGLDQLKFLTRLSDTLNREQKVNTGIVSDFRRQLSTTYGDVLKRHPERAAAILEAHDVDPTPFIPGYRRPAASPNDTEAKKAALRAKLGLK